MLESPTNASIGINWFKKLALDDFLNEDQPLQLLSFGLQNASEVANNAEDSLMKDSVDSRLT